MIFKNEFTGNKNDIFNNSKFREFNLPDDGRYTTRSLELIYQMYCNWLNTRHGMYLNYVKLSISDDSDLCSESLIDYLFHRVQGDIESRKTCSDKSIGFLWKTYREDTSTIHEGLFLVPMTKAEMQENPRGENAEMSQGVNDIFGRINNQFEFRLYGQLLEEECDNKPIKLKLRYSELGEGHRVIFSDSSFEMHERGFVTLCDIADLSKDADSVIFRTRCGYTPTHSYFNTSIFEPFFATT